MAAELIFPQNKIVDVDGSTINIEWTATQPQSSFEVQYKLHSSSTWSTCGVINEPNTRKYSVMNIYNLVGADFYEVYYRLIINYSGTNGIGAIEGKEVSPTYSLIFRHGINNTLKLYDGVGTIEYPISSSISINNTNKSEVNDLKVSKNTTTAGIVHTPVVSDGHPMASNLNISINPSTGTKMHPINNYANFTTPAEYGSSYFKQTWNYNSKNYSAYNSTTAYASYTGYALSTAYYYEAASPASNKRLGSYNLYEYIPSVSYTKRYIGDRITNPSYYTTSVSTDVYYYYTYYESSTGTCWSFYYAYAGSTGWVWRQDVRGTFYDGWWEVAAGSGVDSYTAIYASVPTYSTGFITTYAYKNDKVYKTSLKTATGSSTYDIYYPTTVTLEGIYNSYYYVLGPATSQSTLYTENIKYSTPTLTYSSPFLSKVYNNTYAGIYKYYSGSTAKYDRGYYASISDNVVSYGNVTYYKPNKYYDYTPGSTYYDIRYYSVQNKYYYYNTTYTKATITRYYLYNTNEYTGYVSYYNYSYPVTTEYTYISGTIDSIIGYRANTSSRYHRKDFPYAYVAGEYLYYAVPGSEIMMEYVGSVLNYSSASNCSVTSTNVYGFKGYKETTPIEYYTGAASNYYSYIIHTGNYELTTYYSYNSSLEPRAKYLYNSKTFTMYKTNGTYNYRYYLTNSYNVYTYYSLIYTHI